MKKDIFKNKFILDSTGDSVASSNAEENNNEMVVTPWEVKGKIDYERLIAAAHIH